MKTTNLHLPASNYGPSCLLVPPCCRTVPLSQRKVVLYMSRNGEDPARGLSRRIQNEDLLLYALKAALKVGGGGAYTTGLALFDVSLMQLGQQARCM